MKEIKQIREIDIVGEVKKVFKEWKLLLVYVIVGAIIGVIVALSTPKSYTASVVLAPEVSSGGLGMSESLGDLASSFGIDLGNKSSVDAIYPELYPEIFASTDFVLSLFNVPVRLKDDERPRTYVQHLLKDTKAPFWSYPKMWLSEWLKKKPKNGGAAAKDSFKISEMDDELCQAIRSTISCQVDKKTSVITINVADQDPLVAAILADTLQLRLQEYITNYRTQKARIDYEYYKKLYAESHEQYIQAQKAYASFADANQEMVLQSYKSKLEELENELQLSYNVYARISAQMQNAKAQIQERTPAFIIIEKARMPYKASSTPRSLIVILFVFLAVMIDALWVCFLRDRKKKA